MPKWLTKYETKRFLISSEDLNGKLFCFEFQKHQNILAGSWFIGRVWGMLFNGLKNKVVGVLAKSYPLPAKSVYNAVKGEVQASYQGVHKTLALLEGEGIVVRSKSGFSLSEKWICENKAFFEGVQKSYEGKSKRSLLDLADGESMVLEFDSFLEAGLWFLEEMGKDYALNPEKDVAIICWKHPWPLTTLPEKDFLKLKKLLSRDVHYALCANSTPLDCALMDFWQKIGKNIKTGAKVAKVCDELAIHDYYLQYFLPKKTVKHMDELFKNAKSADGKTLAKYYEILYEKKEKTKVIAIRNRQIADRFRKEALQEYRQTKGKTQSVN